MLDKRIFALALDALAYIPNQVIHNTIEEVRKGCDSSPIMRRSCDSVDQLRQSFVDLANQTGVSAFFANLVEKFQTHIKKEALANRKWGISPEMTQQYHEDMANIVLGALLFRLPTKFKILSAKGFSEPLTEGAIQKAINSAANHNHPYLTHTLGYHTLPSGREGGFSGYRSMMRTDGSMTVYLESNKGIPKAPLRINNDQSLDIQIEQSLLKNLAKLKNATSLYIQCPQEYKRFVNLIHKGPHLSYLGRAPFSSNAERLPVFKVNSYKNPVSRFEVITGLAKPTAKNVQITPLHSPHVQELIDNVYGAIGQHATHKDRLSSAIHKAEAAITPFIRDVSHLGSREQIWSSLLHRGKLAKEKPQIEYFNDWPVAKVQSEGASAIFKEKDLNHILLETVGLDILRSLQLKHLQVPEILAVAKYRSFYVLAKTHIEGETFGSWMEKIALHNLGTQERLSLLDEFTKASFQTGKAIGELHSKGMKYRDKPSLHRETPGFVSGYLEDTIQETNAMLKELRIQRLNDHSARLGSLTNNLERNPGLITYNLSNDIHADQFIYSEKLPRIGHIDAELVPSSLDFYKKPTVFATQDFYEYHTLFDVDGIRRGLNLQEIQRLKKAFNKGYFSEFSGSLTKESIEFFNIYSLAQTVRDLTEGVAAGTLKDSNLLMPFINKLNQRIASHQNPI
jgi:hypothetical protein